MHGDISLAAVQAAQAMMGISRPKHLRDLVSGALVRKKIEIPSNQAHPRQTKYL
jgi:hypothetical protein